MRCKNINIVRKSTNANIKITTILVENNKNVVWQICTANIFEMTLYRKFFRKFTTQPLARRRWHIAVGTLPLARCRWQVAVGMCRWHVPLACAVGMCRWHVPLARCRRHFAIGTSLLACCCWHIAVGMLLLACSRWHVPVGTSPLARCCWNVAVGTWPLARRRNGRSYVGVGTSSLARRRWHVLVGMLPLASCRRVSPENLELVQKI